MDGHILKDNMYLSLINPGEWYKYTQERKEVLVWSDVFEYIQRYMK